jgi:5-methylcytosine-specific restriction endonuclease McrA
MAGMAENLPANMKTPVTDAAVDEYIARICAGAPSVEVFPDRMSECDFTPAQRDKIRKARAERKALQKSSNPSAAPPQHGPGPVSSKAPEITPSKALTKLRKVLYLQGGQCFFCGKPLKEEDASIEHLNPKSRGGTSTEDSEVVCHKTLNHAFGNMDLKRKFEFVLKVKGAFRCPGT